MTALALAALLWTQPAEAAEAQPGKALTTAGMITTVAVPVAVGLTYALWDDAPRLGGQARFENGMPEPQVWGLAALLTVGPLLTWFGTRKASELWIGSRRNTVRALSTWGLVLVGGAIAFAVSGNIAYDEDEPFRDLPWGIGGVLFVSGALVSASAGGLIIGGESGPARFSMGPTVGPDQLGWTVAGRF